MARWTETWLTGTGADSSETPPRWPGEKLGLPETGPGSVAGGGRRLIALLVDWLFAALVASLFIPMPAAVVAAGGDPVSSGEALQYQVAALVAWFVLTVPAAAFFGFTPGMGLIGIRVARLDGATMVGVWRAVVRWVLTVLLIPAAVRNIDGRGWHDRVTGTVVVRMR
ncbi:RDD family protein [Haloechinothrix salitolerans]|uniref:RDD family protein n=1 Tax=Haloechinothrix salitolerans TaxID=926830 RepID=A0ABW2C6Q7_9PSEU